MRSLIVLFGFFVSSLFAGTFEFSGEWLYMLPSIDQPEFVIHSTNTSYPIGKRKANEQSFRSGYRAIGDYRFCDERNTIRLQWTDFPHFRQQKGRNGEELFAILNHPAAPVDGESGKALMRDEFRFYLMDLLFTSKIVQRPAFSFSLIGGVQYGSLRLKETVSYPEAAIQLHSRVWGVGPEIGVEYIYTFLRHWHFLGRANNSWLVSNNHQKFVETPLSPSTADPVSAKDSAYWHLVPFLDVRLGFGFAHFFGDCFALEAEAGYEVLALFRGIERIYFVDSANRGSSFNEQMTFSLQGPYLHVGVKF